MFCLLCIADAITGNTDRHVGNWGFCKSEGIRTLAPIYDNDACLFPRADKTMPITKDWMYERVTKFPNSKIMIKGVRERANYRELITSSMFSKDAYNDVQNLDVVSAMRKACMDFGLSKERTKFYTTVVYYRYTTIVQGKKFVWRGEII